MNPSFPRKRESSRDNNPRSGQCFCCPATRGIFFGLDGRTSKLAASGSFSRVRGNDGLRGFTLLEMLVVLVLASIMLSVAAVQLMPDEQAQLKEEAERLAFLMEQAGTSARAGGQALAWSGSGKEYRFWRRNKQGEWRKVEQDSLLRPRSLPDGVRIAALEIGGRAAQPGEMLLLSPESAAPMFRLRLVSGEQALGLAGDGMGAVKVVKR